MANARDVLMRELEEAERPPVICRVKLVATRFTATHGAARDIRGYEDILEAMAGLGYGVESFVGFTLTARDAADDFVLARRTVWERDGDNGEADLNGFVTELAERVLSRYGA